MRKLNTINDINISYPEGRMLMAAMATLSTQSQRDKSPEQVLQQLTELAEYMFKDSYVPMTTAQQGFVEELRSDEGMRYAYKTNMAMTIFDECQNIKNKVKYMSNDALHRAAHAASERFLKLVTGV